MPVSAVPLRHHKHFAGFDLMELLRPALADPVLILSTTTWLKLKPILRSMPKTAAPISTRRGAKCFPDVRTGDDTALAIAMGEPHTDLRRVIEEQINIYLRMLEQDTLRRLFRCHDDYGTLIAAYGARSGHLSDWRDRTTILTQRTGAALYGTHSGLRYHKPKRLRLVAKTCEDYGCRIEKSVLSVTLQRRSSAFWRALNAIIDTDEDALIAYRVCKSCVKEIQSAGVVERPSMPLVYIF